MRAANVILKGLCSLRFSHRLLAPLVQRPSTSAFQAGDHGFESRTGYQFSLTDGIVVEFDIVRHSLVFD